MLLRYEGLHGPLQEVPRYWVSQQEGDKGAWQAIGLDPLRKGKGPFNSTLLLSGLVHLVDGRVPHKKSQNEMHLEELEVVRWRIILRMHHLHHLHQLTSGPCKGISDNDEDEDDDEEDDDEEDDDDDDDAFNAEF